MKNIILNHYITLNNNLIKISEIENKYKDEVRILVRKSGPEPLIRVMTEGENAELVEKLAIDISNLIEKELN